MSFSIKKNSENSHHQNDDSVNKDSANITNATVDQLTARLVCHTVDDLPDAAAAGKGAMIYVSDTVPHVVTSDGTQWEVELKEEAEDKVIKLGMINRVNGPNSVNSNQSERQFEAGIAYLNDVCLGNITFTGCVETVDSTPAAGNAAVGLVNIVGVDGIVAVLSSSYATTTNNIPNNEKLFEWVSKTKGTLYGEARATQDDMTTNFNASNVSTGKKDLSCFFRTTTTSSDYGQGGALELAQYYDEDFSGSPTVRAITDGAASSTTSFQSFGIKKFVDDLDAAGANVTRAAGNTADPAFKPDANFGNLASVQAYIRDVMLGNGSLNSGPILANIPDYVVGVWLTGVNLDEFHEAWDAVSAAAGGAEGLAMDSTHFVHANSFGGENTVNYQATVTGTIAGAVDSNGLARVLNVQPYFDNLKIAYQCWVDTHLKDLEILWDKTPRAFDATVIVGLVLVRLCKMGFEPSDKSAEALAKKNEIIAEILNTPGRKILPCHNTNIYELLCDKRRCLDYDGASGNMELETNGDLAEVVFRSYIVNLDGKTISIPNPAFKIFK